MTLTIVPTVVPLPQAAATTGGNPESSGRRRNRGQLCPESGQLAAGLGSGFHPQVSRTGLGWYDHSDGVWRRWPVTVTPIRGDRGVTRQFGASVPIAENEWLAGWLWSTSGGSVDDAALSIATGDLSAVPPVMSTGSSVRPPGSLMPVMFRPSSFSSAQPRAIWWVTCRVPTTSRNRVGISPASDVTR